MSNDEIHNLLNMILGEGSSIISPLMGGMMNSSFVVQDKNKKKFVLYIPTEQANEMVDRFLERDNQRIVIELGITSNNVYFDPNTGIKINEYIEGQSLDKVDSWDYSEVAKIFHTLHSSKKVSNSDYQPFKRFVLEYEKNALIYVKNHANPYLNLRNYLFSHKEYLEKRPLVFSHNDAQRSNIIKDENSYHLIDFEFMGNNDEIYDIACFGNTSVEEGRKLLDAYFDNKPSNEQIRVYYLWRIFISLQWYNVALTKHYRGEGKIHGYNFMDVATFFLNNALEAYEKVIKL